MSLSALEPKAREIIGRYEVPKAALLPLLWLVQENQGYISEEAEAWVGRLLGVARSHVREAVSFYSMYHTRPVGRRELRVCTSLPCRLRGAREVLEQIQERLATAPGQTTPGGEITLTEVECLCACEMAPMAQLDETFVGPLDRATLETLLAAARERPEEGGGGPNRSRNRPPTSPRRGRSSPPDLQTRKEPGSPTTSPAADMPRLGR